ncbi:hypothetical protein [Nocardia sp. NPDC020380]
MTEGKTHIKSLREATAARRKIGAPAPLPADYADSGLRPHYAYQ